MLYFADVHCRQSYDSDSKPHQVHICVIFPIDSCCFDNNQVDRIYASLSEFGLHMYSEDL